MWLPTAQEGAGVNGVGGGNAMMRIKNKVHETGECTLVWRGQQEHTNLDASYIGGIVVGGRGFFYLLNFFFLLANSFGLNGHAGSDARFI